MQVELLVVHGANPSILDRLGHTPEECARIAGHHQLADRLIECQYELTDKLSFYLSGRTPVHSIGEHFLVPQGAGKYVLPTHTYSISRHSPPIGKASQGDPLMLYSCNALTRLSCCLL